METFWFFWVRFRHAYDSAYDFDFHRHNRSYDSVYDSVAAENQPLATITIYRFRCTITAKTFAKKCVAPPEFFASLLTVPFLHKTILDILCELTIIDWKHATKTVIPQVPIERRVSAEN